MRLETQARTRTSLGALYSMKLSADALMMRPHIVDAARQPSLPSSRGKCRCKMPARENRPASAAACGKFGSSPWRSHRR
jgi:hypothetical protein